VLTRCPTCQTTFRVTAEQLKARQGRVRCGHCQGVFNALETLIERDVAPTAPLANDTVAFQGFEVPALNATPEAPSFAVAEPPVEPAPIEPVIVAAPAVEAEGNEVAEPEVEGEEVAEPEVEYVEIAALEPGEDDDLTDVLTSPDAAFENGFGATEINPAETRAPAEADGSAADASTEQSPDDQFTKTVVGFTWYVEPEPAEEPPVAEPPAEDYTRTVVQSVRMDEPEVAPEPAAEPAAAEYTRTVIAPWRIATPEAPPEPETTPAATRADTDDFAKTVVQSIRMFEPDILPAAMQEPAANEFEETATLPLIVNDEEITTLVGDSSPANAFTFPDIEPLTVDVSEAAPESTETFAETHLGDTVIDRVSIAEPEPEPESMPAQAADEDDFAKTVVQSIRMFEPEMSPEPDKEPLTDEFESTVVQPRRVGERETVTAVAAEPPGHEFAFEMIEPDETEAEPVPLEEAGEKQFTKTEVDLESVSHSPREDDVELDFDLAPIDDIHVEEVEETPSIVDLSIATPTAFPTLEPLSESDEQPSHETANAILQQLAAGTHPRHAAIADETVAELAEPIAEPESKPDAGLELEAFLANAFASEPSADAETGDEAEAAPEAESIPELQELPRHSRWPWVLGGVVAICLLAAQAIVHYRVELSVRIPGSKPALQAMCDVLDCKLPLPSQIDLIGIETSDLSPGPEGTGHLQLAATLRNRAPFGQAWPNLELTLTDSADKALVRRVVTPADYLPPAHKPEDGFPARSEQPVHLDLQAPGVPAVGYRLYVFYP
jgi:predicted Zn finger-like uncharacterized protein